MDSMQFRPLNRLRIKHSAYHSEGWLFLGQTAVDQAGVKKIFVDGCIFVAKRLNGQHGISIGGDFNSYAQGSHTEHFSICVCIIVLITQLIVLRINVCALDGVYGEWE